jgi:predicted DNA-binding protein (MmcQ/YjbR family)
VAHDSSRNVPGQRDVQEPITDDSVLERDAWCAALALEETVQGQPFGPNYDVFKVGGKVFMLTTEVPGRMVVTLKCEPDLALLLQAEYPTITPGYHMNKKHWISIAAGSAITRDLISELVSNAYLLVVDKLPRHLRPPGLHT